MPDIPIGSNSYKTALGGSGGNVKTAPSESEPCPNQKHYRSDLEADDEWTRREKELHDQECYNRPYHENVSNDGCCPERVHVAERQGWVKTRSASTAPESVINVCAAQKCIKLAQGSIVR
jgi:hypothetical protein